MHSVEYEIWFSSTHLLLLPILEFSKVFKCSFLHKKIVLTQTVLSNGFDQSLYLLTLTEVHNIKEKMIFI